MALTIGGKRKPGGFGPRTPLNPMEQRLTESIAKALRALQAAADAEEYIQVIEELDPELMESVLFNINIDQLTGSIAKALRSIIISGSTREAREIIRTTDRIQPSPFAALEYGGQRLPSGIILPGTQAPPVPELEFVIEAPVDRMFTSISNRATDYATTRSAQLVREVDQSNRLTIRRIIGEAFTGPTTVRDTAMKLRRVVGLHSRWANAVLNFDDQQMTRLIKDGLTVDQARAKADVLTKRYRDRLIRRRAEMIARTELMQASNFGRYSAWEASEKVGLVDPVTRKRWVTAPKGSSYGPPCDECTAMAQSSRFNPPPWNGSFPNGLSMPPAHPHCFVGGTVVDGPPVVGSTARWFDGEGIKLTLGEGTVLTGTPNHPILTPQGWIALGSLREGMQVLRCRDRERTAASVDPHHYQEPTRIDNVVEAVGGPGGVPAREVPVSAPDFHGDGSGSEVAVVRANGLLWDDVMAELGEPFSEDLLGNAAVLPSCFHAGGVPVLAVDPHGFSALGGVGGLDVGTMLLRGAGSDHQDVGFFAPTGLDVIFQKDSSDDVAGNVQAVRDALLGFSSEVATDYVTRIERVSLHEPVYNVETIDGWYTANGVIVHNCRCTAVLIPPARGLTGLPSQDLSPWLSRLDELEAQDAAA